MNSPCYLGCCDAVAGVGSYPKDHDAQLELETLEEQERRGRRW